MSLASIRGPAGEGVCVCTHHGMDYRQGKVERWYQLLKDTERPCDKRCARSCSVGRGWSQRDPSCLDPHSSTHSIHQSYSSTHQRSSGPPSVPCTVPGCTEAQPLSAFKALTVRQGRWTYERTDKKCVMSTV